MISNNRRFLTITPDDNKVYFGLLGIKDAIWVDLETEKYATYISSGKLELDSYTIKNMNWENIENSETQDHTFLGLEYRKVKFISGLPGETRDFKLRRSFIDEEQYGFTLVNRVLNLYYEGYRGWQKIIEIHAIQ